MASEISRDAVIQLVAASLSHVSGVDKADYATEANRLISSWVDKNGAFELVYGKKPTQGFLDMVNWWIDQSNATGSDFPLSRN